MADISATLATLSSTESSNAPTGATAVGTGLDDNLRMLGALMAGSRDGSGWFGLKLTSVSGTNTVAASVTAQGSITMAPTAYATGQRYQLIPAATNTGASTLNVNGLGAKNIFYGGRALVGGELAISVPVAVEYDGTQFNMMSPIFIDKLTEDYTPDGTADYVESYDAGATAFKKIKLNNLPVAATSGGSMVLLGSKTCSATANVSFAHTGGTGDVLFDWTLYDKIEFHFVQIVPASNSALFQGQISEDSGTSYKSGAASYSSYLMKLNNAAVAVDASSSTLFNFFGGSGFTQPNSGNYGLSGTVTLFKPQSTVNKSIKQELIYNDNGATGIVSVNGAHLYNGDTNAWTGIKFFYSGINITSGTIYAYGIKTS